MVSRTEIYNFSFKDTWTTMPGNDLARDGWEITQAGNWNTHFEVGLSVNSSLGPGYSRGINRVSDDMNIPSDEIIEFEIDLKQTYDDSSTPTFNFSMVFRNTELADSYNYEFTFNSDGTGNIKFFLQAGGDTWSGYPFRFSGSIPPGWSYTQTNTIRFRVDPGNPGRCWISPKGTNFWSELINNKATKNCYAPDPVTEFAEYDHINIDLANSNPQTLIQKFEALRIYTVESTEEISTSGLVDENGDRFLGVDPDDDGSGTSTGGSGGFGGGGITDGTDSIIGGRYVDAVTGAGAVGSGSEENVSRTSFTTKIGTGDNSAWSGGGSGINLLSYSYTREMDGFGFGEVRLVLDDNWSSALFSFIGKTFRIQEESVNIFDGVVTEVHLAGRHEGVLILKEPHHKINDVEAAANFAEIITTTGLRYTTVSAVSGTTITLTDGDTSSLATDGSNAVMVVPGDDPAASDEDFDTLVAGTGTIGDVNTDDANYVDADSNIPDDVDEIIIRLSYSGVRADVTSFEGEFKVSSKLFFTNQIITLYIYNYTTTAYELVETYTVAGSLIPGWTASITLNELQKFDSDTPEDYISNDVNKYMQIKITYDLWPNDLRCSYANIKVYSDPKYDGTTFPITALPTGNQITSSSNFTNAGVGVGDTVVVGLRNDLALTSLLNLLYFNFSVDIDSSFTKYTASNFQSQKATIADAVTSILKKNQGIFYYDPTDSTLYLKHKDNLTDYGITLSNSSFKGGMQVSIKEAQRKQSDLFSGVQVTGNTYKVYDGEASVQYTLYISGKATNKLLRITDTSINSWTEAEERAKGEKNLLSQSEQPVYNIDFVNYTGTGLTITVGALFNIQYFGTLTSDIPLRMLNVSKIGSNPAEVNMEFGWKGTTFEDREIDDLNDVRKRVRLLENGLSNRPEGSSSGVISSHSHSVAHSDLTGVGSSDHHTKYTDAEAVSAMGAKGDSNSLNHDKYTLESHTHTESEITDLAHTDANAIHDNTSAEINAITEKASPVSADLLLIEDSAASNAKKKVQIGNLPSGGVTDHGALTGLGDDDHTQYVLKSGSITQITTRNHSDLQGTGSSDHHVKYTDAEAVDAVEAVGAATPISSDKVIFSDAGVLKQAAFSNLDENVLSAIKSYIDASYTILRPGARKADNGAVEGILSGNLYHGVGWYLPASDVDCRVVWIFPVIPSNFPLNSCTLKVVYIRGGTTGTFSVKWYISSYAVGETPGSNNILNGSTLYDFSHPGTQYKNAERTISLSMTNITTGDVIVVGLQSDAGNSNWLFIKDIYLEFA